MSALACRRRQSDKLHRAIVPSINGTLQAPMEFLNRDRGVSGKAHGIQLGVIDTHLCRIGQGTLRSRTLKSARIS